MTFVEAIDGALDRVTNEVRDQTAEAAAIIAKAYGAPDEAVAAILRLRGLPLAERTCAKCGCETKGEEAWVNGEIWCHPCADTVAIPSTTHEAARE